ncbi:hypothetical protein [Legionella feeleii]|uniref:Uncharacterized protein n=1 Tax=Legionella feeleii TaxID=453 RepID=A0A0W0TH41_9GAMM|nr:hypothetical protein [Legionella feeleii]KTC94956.1 hypothetical protein Lfee_2620 [Legionella feeleii]SPX60792.1 Uncharacterised protein [Legionella feeleii]
MSRLQNLVNSLVSVILNYTDPKRLKGHTEESLLQKSHEDLIKDLTQLIKDATASYETRRTLLDYFLYELNTLKPLADKSTPLGEAELKRIETHLLALITNTQDLLKIDKTSSLPVSYNEEDRDATVKISGFIDGGNFYSSTCRSGQVIQRWHEGIEKLSVFPADSLKDAQLFLDHIIDEHHSAILLPHLEEENRRLKVENTRLSESEALAKREKEALQEKLRILEEREKLSAEENKRLQKELELISESEALSKREKEALQEKLPILEEREKLSAEENKRLQDELALSQKQEQASRLEAENLRIENLRLYDESASLAETKDSLEKDNTRLVKENASLIAAASRVRTTTVRPLMGMTGLGPQFFAPSFLHNPGLTGLPPQPTQTTAKNEGQSTESPQFL